LDLAVALLDLAVALLDLAVALLRDAEMCTHACLY
jgi:hypothetical protein